MKSFKYLYDYYPEPVRDFTEDQLLIREDIQAFMTGVTSNNLLTAIEKAVTETVENEKIDLVCFAPGSTGAKTILRFGELADRLSTILPCDVYLDAVTLASDTDPATQERQYQCNKSRVIDKKVLVVGSIYSTGKSMDTISKLLLKNKAKSVYGLFVAKTIN